MPGIAKLYTLRKPWRLLSNGYDFLSPDPSLVGIELRIGPLQYTITNVPALLDRVGSHMVMYYELPHKKKPIRRIFRNGPFVMAFCTTLLDSGLLFEALQAVVVNHTHVIFWVS